MKRNLTQLVLLVVLQSFIVQSYAHSQIFGTQGEAILGEVSRRIDRGAGINVHHLSYTAKHLYIYTISSILFGGDSGGDFKYSAPQETRIVSADFKSDNPDFVFVLLSNGIIVVLRYNPNTYVWKEEQNVNPNVNLTFATKIVGDAVYVLKSGKVYASWDTAKTWAIDSINIGQQTVADITVDTNNYAWVITQSRNLYHQHPDSNIWRQDTSFTTTGFPQAIFVDRKGRMFISTTASASRVWMSTNGGVSWINTSTGITETIASFGDDAFGNIYAVGIGSKAYRLSNLIPPWISIADSINAQAYLLSSAKIVNSIRGDTLLYAATKYGMFQSKDFGANWEYSVDTLQLPSYNFYTGVVKAGSYYFVSNNLGIFRVAAGDSIWEKIFPKQGYINGVNVLTSDSAGNVYGNLPIKTGPTTYLFYTVKSTDHGDTWIPDTAGFKALGINVGTQTYDYFVDKQGMQYLGGNGVFYSKKIGQAWMRDTAGISMKSGEYIADVSRNNKKGIIYLCRRVGTFPTYSIGIYRRSISDTVWQSINTSTLAASEGRMISDHEGNIIVRTLSGAYKVWRYDGSTWTEIPLPTGIGSTPFINPMTVDNDGVIWGAFFAGGSNKGIYFTSNNGTNWKYVGLNKVGIPFLSAIEESTTTLKKSSGALSSAVYATSFIDGIYRFTTASEPTTVEFKEPEIAKSYELSQNYPNPFNPTTRIEFTLPNTNLVTLKIYDIIGREVATLINEEKSAGRFMVEWDGKNVLNRSVAGGIYFYQIKAGNFVQSKKMLLLK